MIYKVKTVRMSSKERTQLHSDLANAGYDPSVIFNAEFKRQYACQEYINLALPKFRNRLSVACIAT